MYRVVLEDRAKKEIKNLSPDIVPVIVKQLLALKNNPRPKNAKKLKGSEGGWSLRIGSYRALYTLSDDDKVVVVYRVKHRKEVYR